MSTYKALLSPFTLKHLTLRNRVMSAAHAPGYAEAGKPGLRYQLYHEEKARGGVALSMFGGSSNIARDSGSIYGQIYVGSDAIIPHFREFSERIHRRGAALMCQITHMGRRTAWDSGEWLPTMGPSPVRDPAHHSMPREMDGRDIVRVVKAFGQAARRCREGGLDGCEILATTHLLGQFLSPLSNRRTDAYGGAVENRLRFLLEALEEVRRCVGDDFIVGVRYAANESNEGGYGPDTGIAIGRLIAAAGTADFLNVNGAYAGTTHGLAETYAGMAFPGALHADLAGEVRAATGLPVFQSAWISDPATADFTVAEGRLDMVGMTRPLMADPHLVAKLERGEEHRIRPCVGAGYCVDRIYGGRDALCLHNPATGREAVLPHSVPKAEIKRKVVVVGGGAAGMEAARVCALRGHSVVLFEAADRLGGQIVLAARAGWRRDIIGIADWLAGEVERLGVAVRTNLLAEPGDVLAGDPDVVVVATGGIPNMDLEEGGGDLATSGWDVLGGHVPVGDKVLLYDGGGGHPGVSIATFLADAGAGVELVTPDRMAGRAIGGQNYPIYLRDLYGRGVEFTPDHRLVGLRRAGNRLVATLKNDFTRRTVERHVDQVVVEQGTFPVDDLFHALRERSANLGETDLDALLDGRPQPLDANPGGRFGLFRVGDAVAGRDIHAAIHDALRLCVVL